MAGGPRIAIILGPTASGKSALAMALAGRVGGEILSVDSMQVYRGMDIGTAKPSAVERAIVRHHCIDLAGPDEVFTVARFVDAADGVIAASQTPLVATVARLSTTRRCSKDCSTAPPPTPRCATGLPPNRPTCCTTG